MFLQAFRSWREHRQPRLSLDPDWANNRLWMATARPCPEFRLDAGYAVTHYVPGWLLPADTADDPPIALPELPRQAGHVLTADAVGHEAELIRHFAQLPLLPSAMQRRETARFCCLEVNLLLCLPGEHSMVVDTFAGSVEEASRLLSVLADTSASPAVLYDNLDQGWASRIIVETEEVFVLHWNWDAPDPHHGTSSWRLPRTALAGQATAARERLRHLHGTLVSALGRDLWRRSSQ